MSRRWTIMSKAAVRANVWQSALPPLYLVVSNLSVLFILLVRREECAGQWAGRRGTLRRSPPISPAL